MSQQNMDGLMEWWSTVERESETCTHTHSTSVGVFLKLDPNEALSLLLQSGKTCLKSMT